ncbi:MAG: hypothetical protein RIQ79_17, partial [Verrucomicrobiota bacterium]
MKRLLPLTALALVSARFSLATETAVPAAAAIESNGLRFGSLSVYIENDKFFTGTDHNYTNGVKLSLLSTNLRAFDSDTVPGPLRALSRAFRPLMSD